MREAATWPLVLTPQLDGQLHQLPWGPPCSCRATWPGERAQQLPGSVLRAFLGEGGTVTLLESEPQVRERLEGFLPGLLGLLIPRELPSALHSQRAYVQLMPCALHSPLSREGQGRWEA